MTLRLPLGFLALWLLTSCASHFVTRGADLYASGYYVEAAEVFEHSERRLPGYSFPERARYGLYRGATLLALGDLSRAESWLDYSAKIERSHPASLSEDERRMLSRALELSLAHRTDQNPLPAAAAAKVAASGAQPVDARALQR